MRLVAAVLLVVALAGCGGQETFLDRYVEDDGRVVRHDQGGDTVSEGQAYAMLLAVAANDKDRFAQVWEWTRANLQRHDRLLASHWAGGRVVDDQPATDADLDAARALALAGDRFDEPRYAAAGRAIARAIAQHETAWAADRTVLVAGPWARGTAVVNPSYWSPRAFRQLGFDHVATSSRQLTERLLESGLPPDWARVDSSGVVASGPPSGGQPGYSYDAVRLPVRLAESCDREDRELAARMWPHLRERPGAARRGLDGAPASDDQHPAALVGAAAAARAAGDRRASSDLLARAAELAREHPSYYGDAWVELGHEMLEAGTLGRC